MTTVAAPEPLPEEERAPLCRSRHRRQVLRVHFHLDQFQHQYLLFEQLLLLVEDITPHPRPIHSVTQVADGEPGDLT
ncbi:hypothetical protein [Streptomyces sp. NPDC048641]|uniref:hypothetical protein n=1 Tax=unclassified Streptomyces TaxID=2593676 RepID=UPI003449B539